VVVWRFSISILMSSTINQPRNAIHPNLAYG
jgi:hypothetical protein